MITMAAYAQIVNDVIVNAIEADADFATAQNLTPMPDGAGIGWTLTNGTWTAPAPPPPTAQQSAQTNLQQLATTASAQLAQAQADAAMFASTPVGSTLTQAHIDALGRFANGFASLIDAISNHCVYTGAIPPNGG